VDTRTIAAVVSAVVVLGRLCDGGAKTLFAAAEKQ